MNIEGRELNTETNTMSNTPVLAMYDVRGIQKYIFKTIKVKDARGASGMCSGAVRLHPARWRPSRRAEIHG